MIEIRDAELPGDIDDVERLWLDYLLWGNDELESRQGFRLPVEEAVERDLTTIDKFEPPDGRLLRSTHHVVETASDERCWTYPSKRRAT
jgi:hypothetical protein